MKDDDIQDLINSVVSESEDERQKKMIENYIARAASYVSSSVGNGLDMIFEEIDAETAQYIRNWKKTRGGEMAYQIRRVLERLLRQELLHEK